MPEAGEVPEVYEYVQTLNDNAFRSRIYGGGGLSPLIIPPISGRGQRVGRASPPPWTVSPPAPMLMYTLS